VTHRATKLSNLVAITEKNLQVLVKRVRGRRLVASGLQRSDSRANLGEHAPPKEAFSSLSTPPLNLVEQLFFNHSELAGYGAFDYAELVGDFAGGHAGQSQIQNLHGLGI
jgi:hypothetical protein